MLDNNFKESDCVKIEGCIWSPVEGGKPGTPWCYFDKTKVGYQTANSVTKSTTGIEATLNLKPTAKKSTSFAQIESIKFQVTYLTDTILRFKIFDPNNKRYEVPVQQHFPLLKNNPRESDENKRKYTLDFSYDQTKDDFHFSIIRKDSKTKM